MSTMNFGENLNCGHDDPGILGSFFDYMDGVI